MLVTTVTGGKQMAPFITTQDKQYPHQCRAPRIISVCPFVCLSVCLSICLSASLPVCQPLVCLLVCLSAGLSVCLLVCVIVCLPVCWFTGLSACLLVCLSVCQLVKPDSLIETVSEVLFCPELSDPDTQPALADCDGVFPISGMI